MYIYIPFYLYLHHQKYGFEVKVPVVSKKSLRDGQPKRPLTSYILFSTDVRQAVQEAHPGTKVTRIAQLIGEKWKALSEEQKQVFY